jgi:hypothetical protein
LVAFSLIPSQTHPKLKGFYKAKAVNKKPVSTAAYLDKLLEIIRTYPLDVNEPDSPAQTAPVVDAKLIPKIILSESFATT